MRRSRRQSLRLRFLRLRLRLRLLRRRVAPTTRMRAKADVRPMGAATPLAKTTADHQSPVDADAYVRCDLDPSFRGTRRTARFLTSVCGWGPPKQDGAAWAQAVLLAHELVVPLAGPWRALHASGGRCDGCLPQWGPGASLRRALLNLKFAVTGPPAHRPRPRAGPAQTEPRAASRFSGCQCQANLKYRTRGPVRRAGCPAAP